MKKFITTFLTIAMLAISLPMLAGSASAQRRTSYNQDRYSREYRTAQQNYQYNQQYYGYEQPSTYDKHRKAVNLAAGAGIGAIIGAIVGGKKGALIGGAAGLAGGAVVTAKQKPRNPNSEDYYRNQYPYYNY
jgi:outer membrane lipoprotein SlyB